MVLRHLDRQGCSLELPEEVRAALTETPCWFLATCRRNVPNVVPIGFKWVERNDLLLADLFLDKTRRNLAENPAVSVSVATTNPKQGFQLKGVASVWRSGEPFEWVRAQLQEKGVEAEPHAAVLIAVDEVYMLDPGPDAGNQIL
jgi:predicted pyridoxine 5'-phosphate oxidase superfamily flavin-nucleotide-binding protein